jgi:hypothetical protein
MSYFEFMKRRLNLPMDAHAVESSLYNRGYCELPQGLNVSVEPYVGEGVQTASRRIRLAEPIEGHFIYSTARESQPSRAVFIPDSPERRRCAEAINASSGDILSSDDEYVKATRVINAEKQLLVAQQTILEIDNQQATAFLESNGLVFDGVDPEGVKTVFIGIKVNRVVKPNGRQDNLNRKLLISAATPTFIGR